MPKDQSKGGAFDAKSDAKCHRAPAGLTLASSFVIESDTRCYPSCLPVILGTSDIFTPRRKKTARNLAGKFRGETDNLVSSSANSCDLIFFRKFARIKYF